MAQLSLFFPDKAMSDAVQKAKHLAEARNIVVIGYSLPNTDQFFRYLYALGSVGKARIENFWVINPDKDHSVEAKFRSLLGAAAVKRFNLIPRTFGAGIEFLKSL